MKEYLKVFFKTYDAFNSALLNNQINYGAIVFIQDKKLIWTHNTFFDCDLDQIKSDIQNVQSSVTNLQTAIGANVDEVSGKFAELNAFLQSISDTELGLIIGLISAEEARAKASELDLQTQINVLRLNQGQGGFNGNTGSDGVRHIILSLQEYDALTVYDQNTIYFIIDSQEWTLGDNLPIILCADHTALGQGLPIILSEGHSA